MNIEIIISVLAVCICCVIRADEDLCKADLPNDVPKNEPVYLEVDEKGNYSLYEPTDGYVRLEHHKSLAMYCSGRQNTFDDIKYNLLTVSCNENNEFVVDNEEVDFNTLYCKSKSSGNARLTKNKCANDHGVLNEIGFQVTTTKFVKLFDVCYNNDTASAIYTKHYVNGKAFDCRVRESNRASFQSIGITKTVKPSASYKQAAMESRFSQVLGSRQKYFRGPNNLSRGHLAPDGDFIFRTEQFATYFYMNIVPQFQMVNNGNWKKIENIVRELAKLYARRMLIYTGTYQQLELPDNTGNLIPLWLDSENHIEVPKYIWKVVIDEYANTGLAFVTLNNPYANKTELNKICHDVCDQTQIRTKGFEKISSGYTYCCEVNELAERVGVLPTTINVLGLLHSVHDVK